MTEYPAIRNPGRCPTHPGELLREDIIPATGRAKAEISRMLGISRQHLYDILREKKPLSPGVAVRVGKMFGGSAESWMRMQVAFDAWHVEREVDVRKKGTEAIKEMHLIASVPFLEQFRMLG